jgi:hypothetical protein
LAYQVLALELLVRCCSPDELAGLADLLAAPVVAEPQADPNGSPRRWATRTFGRVQIEAYTGLPNALPMTTSPVLARLPSPSSPPRSAAG